MLIESKEQEQTRVTVPTQLTLFRFNPSEAKDILELNLEAEEFMGRVIGVKKALDGFSKQADERLDSLKSREGKLTIELAQINAGITCTTAYLQIRDEISPMGATEQEVVDLFNICVLVNSRFWDRQGSRPFKVGSASHAFWEVKAQKGTSKLSQTVSYEELYTYPQPDWFPGPRSQWLDFIVARSNFLEYLNPQFARENKGKPVDMDELFAGEMLFYTHPAWFPDWFEFGLKEVPNIEQVVAELDGDKRAKDICSKEIVLNKKHKDALSVALDDKFDKSNNYISEKDSELSSKTYGLARAMIYLYATELLESSELNFVSQSELKKRPGERIAIARNQRIAEYIQWALEDPIQDPEFIALWIEKQLSTATLITGDLCNEGMVSALCQALELSKEPAQQNSEKRLHRAIRYDIAPLLRLVDPQTREIAIEYVTYHSRNADGSWVSLTDVLMPISEVIASAVKKSILDKVPVGEEKKLAEVRNYTASWLIRNWRWCYQQVIKSAQSAKSGDFISAKSDLIGPKVEEIIECPANEIFAQEEVEVGDSDNNKNVLSEWQIFYIENPRRPFDKLHQLLGDDYLGYVRNLREYLVHEGITYTVPVRRIINELAVLVQEDRQRAMLRPHIERKITDDAKYDKIRLGGHMRIGLIQNWDDNQMLFFLYNKVSKDTLRSILGSSRI